MKIDPTHRTPQVASPDRDGRRSASPQRAPRHTPAAQVERSSFMRSLDDVEPGKVRKDVVEEVRAALAAGTFEASVDLDKVVDSLLAEL
jgi:anti-sigma28 factor (negative regulator of flagellin synthesis)